MLFRGNLDKTDRPLTLVFCCADAASKISVDLHEDPDETLRHYNARKHEIIEESKKVSKSGVPSANPYYTACNGCEFFKDSIKEVETDKIHNIIFGINPSPCQAKCIYCGQRLEERRVYNKETDAPAWELIFKHLQHYKEKGLFAKNIRFELGSGEITVHPHRLQLYDIVSENQAGWLSNCFIYDENIANNLHANETSNLVFSMDCGLDVTWMQIKGVDNFTLVKNNVAKYVQAAAKPRLQIMMKYIILPGINDDIDNLTMFMSFVKSLDLDIIAITKDRTVQTAPEHIRAAVILATLAWQNKMAFSFQLFTNDEIHQIKQVVQNALKNTR